MLQRSKEKIEYSKLTGMVEYLDLEYGNLPNRNKGDYRYLILNSYPYPFEIYEPNSESTVNTIDDLNIGDVVDVFFYENNSTHKKGINRFVMFIDHEGEPYFIRNAFDSKIGLVVLGLSGLICLLALFFWKRGDLKW